MSELVSLDYSDGVARVVVANPPVNALSGDLIAALVRVLRNVGGSDARVVLLSGANNTFIAGADISEFPELLADPAKVAEHVALTRPMFGLLGSIPQPVVAGVRGAAIGGGLEIALACDLLVADAKAKFGLPELKLGLIPGGGGTQRLPRLVGRTVASRLIMGGEIIGAEEALRIGLISHLAPEGEYDETVTKVVSRLAAMSRPAIAAAKVALRDGLEMPLPDALQLEESLFKPLFDGSDVREGYQAFVEKRTPRFS